MWVIRDWAGLGVQACISGRRELVYVFYLDALFGSFA